MLRILLRRAQYHFTGSGSELSIVDPNPDPDSAYYCGKIILLSLSSWDFLQKPSQKIRNYDASIGATGAPVGYN
jgi:hypothetical protein